MTLKIHEFGHELDLLSIQQTDTERFPYFLDSSAHGDCYEKDEQSANGFRKKQTALGRYSILFAYPQQKLVLDSGWKLNSSSNNHEKFKYSSDKFLSALDEVWQSESVSFTQESELPFHGGWFLFLAYELTQEIEPSLDLINAHSEQGTGLPIAFAARIPVAIIVDHVKKTSTLIAEPEYFYEFGFLLSELKTNAALQTNMPVKVLSVVEEEPQKYIDAIEATHRYIHEGDIFQANLSREWVAKIESPLCPSSLYKRLRVANPGPFAGMVYYQDHVIMSSSPERLLAVKNNIANTRPIAGTRPRSKFINDDTLMREELLKHPKERAEHIMLIDLERNDLGRVCKTGTVEVDELMVIESYEHVHHIVSNVKGELRDDVTPGQAIKAVFPGGTITGCPKVRCMQIISELETKPREAYTGSMGYLNHNGDMDLNILIRTMQLKNNQLSFRAGGGIVYDSDPQKEVLETRAKAKGLLQALAQHGSS